MALQKSGVSLNRLLRVSDLFPSVSIGKSIDWRDMQIRYSDVLLDVPGFWRTVNPTSSDRMVID